MEYEVIVDFYEINNIFMIKIHSSHVAYVLKVDVVEPVPAYTSTRTGRFNIDKYSAYYKVRGTYDHGT